MASTGSGVVDVVVGGVTVVDDFNRTVAADSLPTGWGTGGIGQWEEGTNGAYYNPPYSPFRARDVESVDGSQGVMDLKWLNSYIAYGGGIRYFGPEADPVIVFAGPSADLGSPGVDYWLKPPFDVYFDLETQLDLPIDGLVFPQEVAFWQAFLGIVSIDEQTMADDLGYGSPDPDAMLHNVTFWDAWYYGVGIDINYLRGRVGNPPVEINPFAWFTNGDHVSSPLYMASADFFNVMWRFRLEVTYFGMKMKMWPRGTVEPVDWMAWNYDDTEHHETDNVGGDPRYDQSPDRYNVLGFDNSNLDFWVYPPVHVWDRPNQSWYGYGYGSGPPYGYSKQWPFSDPGNGYAYPISWPSESHGFDVTAAPSQSMGIIYPSIVDGPWTQDGQNQSIAAWAQLDTRYWYGPPLIPTHVTSVTVHGYAYIGLGGNTESVGATSGTVTVLVKRYTYSDLSDPGWTGAGGDGTEINGGVTVATLSVPWTQGGPSIAFLGGLPAVPFSFTVDRADLSADGVLEWGIVMEDGWVSLLTRGRLSGGLSMPNDGGISVRAAGAPYQPDPVGYPDYWQAHDIVYDVTYDDTPPVPPVTVGRVLVDNVEISSGGETVAIYGQ